MPDINNNSALVFKSFFFFLVIVFTVDFCFQRFFHETVDQNNHVMVRINTPYQQEPPQLFLKNASMPPIADLSFHSNSVLSNAGLPSKPKDKSHNYTNRFDQWLYAFTKVYWFLFSHHVGTTYRKVRQTPSRHIRQLTALANLHVRQTLFYFIWSVFFSSESIVFENFCTKLVLKLLYSAYRSENSKFAMSYIGQQSPNIDEPWYRWTLSKTTCNH